jgi:uncharacterized protein (DUF2147 family)
LLYGKDFSLLFLASIFLAFAGIAGATAPSSPLLGDWTTPDHSVVRVFSCRENSLCVRLVQVGPKDKPQTDVNNPDASETKRALCGLQIGNGFEPDTPNHAKDGHIYDPKSGKTYSAEMTRDGDALKLRGFIGISLFGRTETWRRDTAEVPACQST